LRQRFVKSQQCYVFPGSLRKHNTVEWIFMQRGQRAHEQRVPACDRQFLISGVKKPAV
jgi:hypothetical protein